MEGANVPVTPEAEAALATRGIPVIPDFVVNSATNSWWWWTLFGDVEPDKDSSYDLIRLVMRELVTQLLDRAESGLSPRAAAVGMAEEKLAAIRKRSPL